MIFHRSLAICIIAWILSVNGEDMCEMMTKEYQDQLREELREKNCLQDLEVVDPRDVKRAARIFHRDGFVAVKNALTPEQTEQLRKSCLEQAEYTLSNDPVGVGNRGPHRWSLGGLWSTGHLLPRPEWAQLIDPPAIVPILNEIFGNDLYIVRGARGDFNAPGAPYQPLHMDLWEDFFLDPSPYPEKLTIHDLPVFYVVVNYAVNNISALNAPIRQIPMTHTLKRPIPTLEDEPNWMKRSTVCPVEAGTAIIRDPRAWHGGTPNLSDEIRCLVNVEYYAYWYRYKHKGQMPKSMPRDIYETLSPFGKKLCSEIVADPDEEIDVKFLDDVRIIKSDVLPCYKHLGVTAEDIEELKQQGKYHDKHRQNVILYNFYGRNNLTEQSNTVKDEL